jgi:hypothetical protein
VRTGELGSLRRVMVEYTQDWLMEPLERSGNRQASWRVEANRLSLRLYGGSTWQSV